MKSLIAYAHETYSEEAAYHVFGGMPMRDVQALLLFYKPAFRRQTQLQALQETCIFFYFGLQIYTWISWELLLA